MSVVKTTHICLIAGYQDIIGTYTHSELITVQTLPNTQTPWGTNLPGQSTQGNYLIIQLLGTAR